jgi:hypothetical protein
VTSVLWFWIRNDFGRLDRIRIRIGNADPDPGEQKDLEKRKKKKIHVWKCWGFSFESGVLLL